MNSFLVLADGNWFGRLVAEAVVSQLWQGAAIASGLAFCLRFAPRMQASFRYALWLAAFVLLVALPLVPWASGVFSGFSGAEQSAAGTVAASSASSAWFRIDERWSLLIVALWVLMAFIRVAMLGRGAARARGLWSDVLPLAGVDSGVRAFPFTSTQNEEVNGAQSVGTMPDERPWGRKAVEICSSRRVDRPCVIGFYRPRILIPAWLVGKLTPGELRQIVLHELEHLRRLDDWTNLGLQIALAFLPLNPALLWMERRLDREREMACDEAVVRRTRAPRAYAACLASVAERRMEMKLSAQAAFELAAWRRRPELAERVLSLLRAKETLSPAGRAVFAGVFSCALLAATVGLARCPQLVVFASAPRQVAQANALPPVQSVERTAAQMNPARPAVVLQRKSAHAVAPAPPVESAELVAQTSAQPGLRRVMASMEPPPEQTGWVILTVFEERTVVGPQGMIVSDHATEEDGRSAVSRSDKKVPAQKIDRIPLARITEGWIVWEL